MICFQEEIGQTIEIVFQRLFVEGNSRKSQEIVFEIIQIPGNRLPVEAVAGITEGIIEIFSGFDLKPWQYSDRLPVRTHNIGANIVAGAVFRQEFKKSCVA